MAWPQLSSCKIFCNVAASQLHFIDREDQVCGVGVPFSWKAVKQRKIMKQMQKYSVYRGKEVLKVPTGIDTSNILLHEMQS